MAKRPFAKEPNSCCCKSKLTSGPLDQSFKLGGRQLGTGEWYMLVLGAAGDLLEVVEVVLPDVLIRLEQRIQGYGFGESREWLRDKLVTDPRF